MLLDLNETQVAAYVEGDRLSALRQLLASDPIVQEMARTPLLLNAMAFTYRDDTYSAIAGLTSKVDRTNHLFRGYFRKRFDKLQSAYTLTQTQRYLTWLAQKLEANSQYVFYLENMQPTWLFERARPIYLYLVGAISGFLSAIAFGLVVVLYGLSVNLAPETVVGITVSLAAALLVNGLWAQRYVFKPVRPFATGVALGRGVGLFLSNLSILGVFPYGSLDWYFPKFILGCIIGVSIGLAAFLIFIIGARKSEQTKQEIPTLIYPVEEPAGSLLAIMTTVFSGLIMVSPNLQKNTSPMIEQKVIPNQGIRRSLVNSLRNGLIFGVFAMIVSFGANGIISNFNWKYLQFELPKPVSEPLGSLIVGFAAFVFVALGSGGFACIKHFVLRWILYHSDNIPFNYADFLDFAANIGMLRKVGGGYLFIHRYLLEYFSSLKLIS